MEISKNIDFRIYSRSALEKTCKEFSEFCDHEEKKIDDTNTILKIKVKDKNINVPLRLNMKTNLFNKIKYYPQH